MSYSLKRLAEAADEDITEWIEGHYTCESGVCRVRLTPGITVSAPGEKELVVKCMALVHQKRREIELAQQPKPTKPGDPNFKHWEE